MRKFLFISFISVLALSSCKKKYSCHCTDNAENSTGLETFLIENNDEGNARVDCTAHEVEFDDWTCTLR